MMDTWTIECNFKNIWEYHHFITNCALSEIYPWSIDKLNDNLFEQYSRGQPQTRHMRQRWHYTESEREPVEAWMTWMSLKHLTEFTVEHWRSTDYA